MKISLLVLLTVTLLNLGFLRATVPRISRLPPLANGDLVFQTDRSKQMLAIFLATGSVYTDVGIIEIDNFGVPYVIEAAHNVHIIALSDWIRHGYGDRFTVKRMRGLTPETAAEVVGSAQLYLGRRYDIFFQFGRARIYGSELVYYAFQDRAKINLGQVQTISALNLSNFAAREIIAAQWRRDPVCQVPGVSSFSDCFAKIQQQPIITPVSIARDPRLVTIYSNYGTVAH
jgi:hypothetical protein